MCVQYPLICHLMAQHVCYGATDTHTTHRLQRSHKNSHSHVALTLTADDHKAEQVETSL